MPLIIEIPHASVRLNYLFNRLEISRDQRQTWEILYEDPEDSLGMIDGITFHRDELLMLTESGIYRTDPQHVDWQLLCPQRKNGQMVDIESFENMLYACTNHAVYQASSGTRWRLKYDGQTCGHFYSLLSHNGELLAACDKGVYCASQSGKFWHPRFHSADFGKFLALDAREGKLYAQTEKGYVVSESNAQHWQLQNSIEGPWTHAMGGNMLFRPRQVRKSDELNSLM